MIVPFLEKLTEKCIKQTDNDLNSGGCGIYACIISNELTKRKIKHHFIFTDDYSWYSMGKTKFRTNKINVRNLIDKHIGANHVYIKVKQKFINKNDSQRDYVQVPSKLNSLICHNIQQSMEYNEVFGCWNDFFGEKRCELIPLLKKTIKNEFRKYDRKYTKKGKKLNNRVLSYV